MSKQKHKKCYYMLGFIICWLLLCIFHFSSPSSNHARSGTSYRVSPYLHSLRHVLHSTAHSFTSKPLPTDTHKHPLLPNHSLFNYTASTDPDPCFGKRIYIHRLPSMYNEDLTADCSNFKSWKEMCKILSNDGLGPKLDPNVDASIISDHGWFDTNQFAVDASIISDHGWFDTNQFAVEVIFHNRMKHYKCLTQDSSKADLVYVPFYAGLDISRFLWGGTIQERDNLSLSLAHWLKGQDAWKAMGGRDHFMVCGHMTWDFRRLTDAEHEWGNKLLHLDVTQSMSTLLIDKSPWHTNDYAIPYPTYFHPQNHAEVMMWQERVRNCARPALFSFAGAPRETMRGSIRGELIHQCNNSRACTLLACNKSRLSKCSSPLTLMRLFQESVFCLQPQGDSATRRSTFDSMIAGCIPVFFHPHSAYIQYIWHFPKNHSEYSVYIPQGDIQARRADIENILKSLPAEYVEYMRETVISLIPTLVYANPSAEPDFEDAFEVSVQALLRKVSRLRSRMF